MQKIRKSLIRSKKKQQEANKKRREVIAELTGRTYVSQNDLIKYKLWEELATSPCDRCCPYTGEHISLQRLFMPDVEIEHILPYSRTLDDSLNNKTLAMRRANQAKGECTPYEAFGQGQVSNINYEQILARVKNWKKEKRYRFFPDAEQIWLKNDKDFVARALTDTQYFSRMAKEYVEYICPDVWVSSGRSTALLRRALGLNNILDESNKKNRDDHRHHAIDACVIGVTDRMTLNRLSSANKYAREKQSHRTIEGFTANWPTFREQVQRAISNIYVSFKPDHSYERAFHNDTAYGLEPGGKVHYHRLNKKNNMREYVVETLNVIPMTCAKASERHGCLDDGSPKAYKGYKGDSNYCIEVFKDEKDRWKFHVVTTYEAYQIVRKGGLAQLRNKAQAQNGRPLVMRLMRNDMLRLEQQNGELVLCRICKICADGRLSLAPHNEANVDSRDRDKKSDFHYIVLSSARALQKLKARQVTVSVTGKLRDPGFRA